ncbi:MAG: RNA polymerase sigma-70 factor [Bacteroidetes bacterium]|nr:RNA polymerase sigma-70 factor [Bacteroidota bacterium]MDA1122232.1 RNA polymerase sigma-70 factor [Bacteroidota bacterium]
MEEFGGGTFGLSEFRQLFDQYFKQVKNFIYYKLGDVDAAEDIAQECFVKVWENRQKVKPESAKSYLYTIANNLTINQLKRQKVILKFLSRRPKLEHNENPEFAMQLEEFSLHLQKAVSNLSEKQRIVFLMNRIDSLTYAEIATRLGISVKAVEKRMTGALMSLRETISYKI